MSADVFDLNNRPSNLSELELKTNPWDCSACKLCWAKLGQGWWITITQADYTTCSSPGSLSGKDWPTDQVTAGNIKVTL